MSSLLAADLVSKGNGFSAWNGRGHVKLRPAGDDQANPVGKLPGIPGQHFHEFVASVPAGFVERVNDDQIPLASAGDGQLQGVGEQAVEQFRGVLPVQFGHDRQRQQQLAIVGKPGGHLERQRANDAAGVAVVRFLPIAELDGDDGAPAIFMRELGGEGTLANARRTHEPEES